MPERITYDWDDAFESTCGPLVEGSATETLSTARARIENTTEPHYHEDATELYRVLEGEGVLRTRPHGTDGYEEYRLEAGDMVLIEPGIVHQTRPDDALVVETINAPPWQEDDEYVVEATLFP